MANAATTEQTKKSVIGNIRQDYKAYRKAILGRTELIFLTYLRPWIVVRDTLFLWIQIVLTWIIVAKWPFWWVILCSTPIIGTRFYALFIIGHDGLHRRLFKKIWLNDLWNDFFVLAPIFSVTRMNRWNHMKHHAKLALSTDPDRYKYISANKLSRVSVLFVLTGFPYVTRAVKNVLITNTTPNLKQSTSLKYTYRDIFILVIWQIFLIGSLSYMFGWWGYIVLWLIPVYIFTYSADIVRVFLEHSMLVEDDDADKCGRLITYVSSPFERMFFAPMNMNFHSAHHLWPGIPYYNLPKADKYMREWKSDDKNLYWRRSYIKYLIEYMRPLSWFYKSNLKG